MPPPNLRPDYEQQAKAFADRLVNKVLRPVAEKGRIQ
jgi:hypothetical protein